MANINNPHDKFFKATFSQPGAVAQFLHQFLPAEVTALFDLGQIQPVKDSFVDASLQEHFSDLIFEVALRDHEQALVCLLFEHKSYVDPLTAFQVLRYMVHGWERMERQRGRLFPMVPIVVYHGTARWDIATDFQGLFELPAALQRYTPSFHYHFSDLSAYRDEDLKATAWLGAGLLALKYIARPELRERLPEVIALWYSLDDEASGLSHVETLLRYLVAAGKHVKFQDVIDAAVATIPLGGALMSTIAEELIEQGVQKGLQQGEQRGELKGLHAGIRLALKVKFGAASDPLLTAIAPIENVVLLQLLADAIEHAESPEQLQAWLTESAKR
ncbi:MAG: Rpn family recombination-promoting nuclease/putative transposase [Chloroflexia bacterium]|nr:Rpn family recombination-promoting nuclease/putative transposase [Chloroflexia bacterium]